jgi:hypothetical protein
MIDLRDIGKGVTDATGIELVIYIMKILYFNHSTPFLSNNFGQGGRTKPGDPETGTSGWGHSYSLEQGHCEQGRTIL